MVVRALKLSLCGLLLGLLCVPALYGCFGPKLFVGVGSGTQDQVLYALVTLYIKEKTGVESTLVDVAADANPLDLITADKVDLVFAADLHAPAHVVFQLDGLPVLATGKRPLDELQFTTVLPAVSKLNGLLKVEDVASLAKRVATGESAMSVARSFLMERRWI